MQTKRNMEEVPRSFWDMIEEAAGDKDRFRARVEALSKEALREAYDQYLELAHTLFTSEHLARMGEDVSEDAWMDVANWVVMQGEEYYKNVFFNPDATPSREEINGPTFASVMVLAFADRFGEWI